MANSYRKHGTDFVVDIENVSILVPLNDPSYLEWLAAEDDQGNLLNNQPLEQDE